MIAAQSMNWPEALVLIFLFVCVTIVLVAAIKRPPDYEETTIERTFKPEDKQDGV